MHCFEGVVKWLKDAISLVTEVRGEKQEQRSLMPAVGEVVQLGRSVGGSGGQEGGQQHALL